MVGLQYKQESILTYEKKELGKISDLVDGSDGFTKDDQSSQVYIDSEYGLVNDSDLEVPFICQHE